MAKIKPEDNDVHRFANGQWEVVDSFGGNPPTANMDEIIVAVGDEQMEASGGDCPVVVLFAPRSRLTAVIHIGADHLDDDHHETMISTVLDRYPFPKTSKVHVLMDSSGYGKPEAERAAWLDRIRASLTDKGLKSVETCTDGEGKNVMLNANDGVLKVEDGGENSLLEVTYGTGSADA